MSTPPSERVHLLLSAGGIRCLSYIGAVGNATALESLDEADADRMLSELAHLVEEAYRDATVDG